MKKTISKLLALALTASLVLSGCGGSGSSETADNQTDENSAKIGYQRNADIRYSVQPELF